MKCPTQHPLTPKSDATPSPLALEGNCGTPIFSPLLFDCPGVSSLLYPKAPRHQFAIGPKAAVPTDHGSKHPTLSQNTPFPSKLVISGAHHSGGKPGEPFPVTLV